MGAGGLIQKDTLLGWIMGIGLLTLKCKKKKKKEKCVLLQYFLAYVCSKFWGKEAIKWLLKLLSCIAVRIVLSEVRDMGGVPYV